MRMGAVHLTVSDLDRSLAYYEQAIGLRAPRARQRHGAARYGRGGPARAHRAAGCAVRRGILGPLPLRAPPPGARRSRQLAEARRTRRRPSHRHVGSPRQRGAVPPRPRLPRDRDLRRPAARDVGGQGRPDDDDDPARHRRPRSRGRRRPVRRASRRERRWGTSTSASRTSRRRSSSGSATASS